MEPTVETTLANSIWVLLTPEAQLDLALVLNTQTTYMGRQRELERAFEAADAQNSAIWSDEAYVFTGKEHTWRWTTFPHPSSWPKQHSNPAVYINMDYNTMDRTYVPRAVFMKRYRKEGAYMQSVSYRALLVYSDLIVSPLLAERSQGSTNLMARLATLAKTALSDPSLASSKKFEEMNRTLQKLVRLVDSK